MQDKDTTQSAFMQASQPYFFERIMGRYSQEIPNRINDGINLGSI